MKTRSRFRRVLVPSIALANAVCLAGPATQRVQNTPVTRPPATPARAATGPGRNLFVDFRDQVPGRAHLIRPKDLPGAHATSSADNPPHLVPRPSNAWPQAPAGFEVQVYADGLDRPRLIQTAPNGDIFVSESYQGTIRVLRGVDGNGHAIQSQAFATSLNKPFGIAFYPRGPDPRWVYVANTDGVVRIPYRNGDVKARAAAQKLAADVPGGGLLRGGGHWTRDLAFSRDGTKMYVSVGSRSNSDDPDENESERNRATILEFNPDGSAGRTYAWGIRNAVGIAVNPRTGALGASVNERDLLGDNLVPDYITEVKEGGFYGWPWYYIGGNQDPSHLGKHPELRAKVIVPDVLLQPHTASLQMTFYEGSQFPAAYRGDIFAAQHGSWNRKTRTGYQVIRVPLHGQDHATGKYEDFLTGFVTAKGDVWGRPVGVTVAQDGALLVSDDGSNTIWRVSTSRIPAAAPSTAPL